ncbi:hypothetical protein C8R42DRAFT_645145 [Lentinula raphanica]|nr:hypothetical protein C8R42DRAFT_645145 [Lentinula raphanica]
MRIFVLLSLGVAAAGFSFTGFPSSAAVNQASSATLIRGSSDVTSFSLILRLTSQNGGSTIKTFSSTQETNIPFSFTPTETGSSASSSSSENAGTSTLSQNTNAATSTTNATPPQTTSSDNKSTPTHHDDFSNTVVSASATQTEISSSITTNFLSSPTEGSSEPGALASYSNAASSNGISSTVGTSTASNTGSINTTPTTSTHSAPSAATSRSSKTGMIIGIVFGLLAFLGLCFALLVAYTRFRRRKRTNIFKRQLMVRQISPLVFNRTAPSPPYTEQTGSGSGDLDRYAGYISEDDFSRDMVESGTGQMAEHNEASLSSQIPSMYSEQSVHSVYSDSPSVFYTAVPAPRPAAGTINTGPSQTLAPPVSAAPTHTALGLTFDSRANVSQVSPDTPSTVSQPSQVSTSESALPQLAPGWVFPRTQPRLSQLPPPKTDRQMEIFDRKARLQGKLIGLQGWGNHGAAEGQAEIEAVKEQIRRLETLENSDWALGKSNEVPIWGMGLS